MVAIVALAACTQHSTRTVVITQEDASSYALQVITPGDDAAEHQAFREYHASLLCGGEFDLKVIETRISACDWAPCVGDDFDDYRDGQQRSSIVALNCKAQP